METLQVENTLWEIKQVEMEPEEKSFGERLIEYRKTHLLTQRQMASLLGISPNHVGVLERGTKQPRMTTAAKFEKLCKKREVRRITDGKPMNEKDMQNLAVLWTYLDEMSPERRNEVMHVFRCILKWFR